MVKMVRVKQVWGRIYVVKKKEDKFGGELESQMQRM